MKQCVDKSKPCFLLPNKKVSRETFVNLREKRANRPFCATILKKKRLFEHNFAAIGGVFDDIFDVLQNFVVFHLFSCYVYCFFEIDVFFAVDFRFFCVKGAI